MISRTLAVALALLITCPTTLAFAEEGADDEEAFRWGPDDFANDLIHSRLPIYGYEWEEFWPRHFRDGDSFGCYSHVSFGDWKFEPNPASGSDRSRWMRLSHYGVLTCATNIRYAWEKGSLEDGEFARGFFALIGSVGSGDQRKELWVLQQGFRTGSDYILLARNADDERVERFSVLQSRCDEERWLGKRLDSWLTSYCAIDTHEELLEFATRMVQFPPLGEYVWQPETKADADSTSD